MGFRPRPNSLSARGHPCCLATHVNTLSFTHVTLSYVQCHRLDNGMCSIVLHISFLTCSVIHPWEMCIRLAALHGMQIEDREASKVGCGAPPRSISGVVDRLRALSRPDSNFEARVSYTALNFPVQSAPTCQRYLLSNLDTAIASRQLAPDNSRLPGSSMW